MPTFCLERTLFVTCIYICICIYIYPHPHSALNGQFFVTCMSNIYLPKPALTLTLTPTFGPFVEAAEKRLCGDKGV